MTFFKQLLALAGVISLANAAGENFGATPDATACSLSNAPSQEGFDVRLYEYDYNEGTDFNANEYVNGGYLDRPLIGTSITSSFNAENDVISSGPIAGDVFGIAADVTNFTAELASYFYATENGYYTLKLDYIDDSVALFFASEGAFLCCTDREIPTSESDFTYNILTSKDFYGPKDHEQYYYQYLEAGKYYPLRMVFTNIAGAYNLSLTVITPSSGSITTGNSGYFFAPSSADDSSSNCGEAPVSTVFQTEISSWTGSTSSFYTDYPHRPTEGVTVHIVMPDPTTTVSYGWTGLSTSSDYATPIGAGTWTETLYIPQVADTTTLAWTGTVTSYTTATPNDPNVHEAVYIYTPDPRFTTTDVWTGDQISTTTFGGGPGNEDTVTVEVFTPRGTDSSTTYWTGAVTTYSTLTPTDLNEHIKVVQYNPESKTSSTDTTSSANTLNATTTTSSTNYNATISSATSINQTSIIDISSTTIAATETSLTTPEGTSSQSSTSTHTYNTVSTASTSGFNSTVVSVTSTLVSSASTYSSDSSDTLSNDSSSGSAVSDNSNQETGYQSSSIVSSNDISVLSSTETYVSDAYTMEAATSSSDYDNSYASLSTVDSSDSNDSYGSSSAAGSSGFKANGVSSNVASGESSKNTNNGSPAAADVINNFSSPSSASVQSSGVPYSSVYFASNSHSNYVPSSSAVSTVSSVSSAMSINDDYTSFSATPSIQTSFTSSLEAYSVSASSFSPDIAVDYSNDSNQKIGFSFVCLFLTTIFTYGLVL